MFDSQLKLSTKPKMTPAKAARAKEVAGSINWNRNNRDDLATSGYKGYFYHLTRTSNAHDKELSELIVSAANMDEAIEVFNSTQLNGELYADATFNIRLMGVDFDPDREEKVVMTK